MSDNAAPFGIFQSDLTPDTDAEYLFDLENDVNAEGFNPWTVSYANRPALGSGSTSDITSSAATLSIPASVPDGDTVTVSFYDESDDSLLGTDTVEGEGMAELELSGLDPFTTYNWYAVANDGTEDSDPGASVEFKTDANPSVASISPANGASVAYTTTQELSATYNDADGGTGSLIFAESDGTEIDTAENVAAGESGAIDWTGLSAGEHTFKVRAFDGENYSNWSSLITFTIMPYGDLELHHSPTRALVDNIITDVTGRQ